MPTAASDELRPLQERLQFYRDALAHYLKQRAILGEAFEPQGVPAGIREARREIARLKAALRARGLSVADHVDDGDADVSTASPPAPDDQATPPLSEPLSAVVAPSPPAAAPLEQPEGNMRPDSPFYIVRQPADRVALAEASKPSGVTLTIKGPRQVGKSSLLTRVIDRAIQAGKQVAYLDFQQFDAAARADDDTFFRQFAQWLTDEVGLDGDFDANWATALGTVQRCTRYVERVLLPALGGPLLLAMDEVDSILDCPFRTDFFAMLRVWHNNRAMPNRPIWRQLDMALVTSTEPYELVENLHQSPFNVGEELLRNQIKLGGGDPWAYGGFHRRNGAAHHLSHGQQSFQIMGSLDGHAELPRPCGQCAGIVPRAGTALRPRLDYLKTDRTALLLVESLPLRSIEAGHTPWIRLQTTTHRPLRRPASVFAPVRNECALLPAVAVPIASQQRR